MVGSRPAGREVTRTMCDDGGASSSVLSRAFDEGSPMLSACSMMKTRASPSTGRKLLSRSRSRMAWM
jgi:hypothetical protein